MRGCGKNTEIGFIFLNGEIRRQRWFNHSPLIQTQIVNNHKSNFLAIAQTGAKILIKQLVG